MNAAFAWVWETTWQASVLVLLVLAAQRLLRPWLTAEWRDALWWLVVIRLCLPVLPESSFSVFNSIDAPTLGATSVPAPLAVAVDVSPADAAATEASPGPLVVTPALPLDSWSMIGVIWALGAVLTLGWTLAAYWNLRRRIAGSPEVTSGRLLMLLDSARRAMKIRRPVRLHESKDGLGPALVGLWRPRLVIPAGLAEELSDEELRFVFLHECGHLRRFDLRLNWLLSALQALHWFNPVLWWAFRRMRADRELACDELTLRRSSNAAAYGETIVRLLERAMHGGRPGLIGLVDQQADIRERIRMIATFHRSTRWSIGAVTAMLALGLTMLTSAKQTPAPPVIALSPVIVSETGTGIMRADLLERVENLVWHSRERGHWARTQADESESGQVELWENALRFHVRLRDRILGELDEEISGDEDRFRLLERERGLWHRQFVRLCNPKDLSLLRNVVEARGATLTDRELQALAKSMRAGIKAIDANHRPSTAVEKSDPLLLFYARLVNEVHRMTREAREGRRRVHVPADTDEFVSGARSWMTAQRFPRAEALLSTAVSRDPRRFIAYALRRTILERRMDPLLYP